MTSSDVLRSFSVIGVKGEVLATERLLRALRAAIRTSRTGEQRQQSREGKTGGRGGVAGGKVKNLLTLSPVRQANTHYITPVISLKLLLACQCSQHRC